MKQQQPITGKNWRKNHVWIPAWFSFSPFADKENKFFWAVKLKYSSFEHKGQHLYKLTKFWRWTNRSPNIHLVNRRDAGLLTKRESCDQDCYQFLFKKQYLYRYFLCNNNKNMACRFTYSPFLVLVYHVSFWWLHIMWIFFNWFVLWIL